MVAIGQHASNLLLSHARDRKYVLIITFSAIFTILYNTIFNPVNDPVANVAVTFLFTWLAFRSAELVKSILLREKLSQYSDKAIFITGEY